MTPDFASAVVSPAHWAAVGITVVTVALTVVLHYEVLLRLNLGLPHWSHLPNRLRVLAVIVILLVLHVSEIWLFGLGLYLAVHFPSLGSIAGSETINFLDAIYLSATSYSTLGYGDLVPLGAIRFLIGTESLVGLMMITWSASFTYLEMQRDWQGPAD
jgi:hypothetical protein